MTIFDIDILIKGVEIWVSNICNDIESHEI